MKTPAFWHRPSWIGFFLSPLGWLYGLGSTLYQKRIQPQNLPVPVVCVGNVVLGGAGKTPTVMALLEILASLKYKPHVLTRGYGRKRQDLLRADPSLHTFQDVGDEALLLAEKAPTWVFKDRFQSGQMAIASGASILIMDDGLQNPQLKKDIIILVLDASQEWGNGQLFPAGPLREPLEKAIEKSSLLLIIGTPSKSMKDFLKKQTKPVFYADLTPLKPLQSQRPVLAFAGIGYPPKFLKTLENMGLIVQEFKEFADHHPYTSQEIELLLQKGLPVLTTTKDWVRLSEKDRQKVIPVPVVLKIKKQKSLKTLLQDLLS